MVLGTFHNMHEWIEWSGCICMWACHAAAVAERPAYAVFGLLDCRPTWLLDTDRLCMVLGAESIHFGVGGSTYICEVTH